MALHSMSYQAGRATLAPPLTSNSLTSKLLKLWQTFQSLCDKPSRARGSPQPAAASASASDRERFCEMEGGRKQIVCAVSPDRRQQDPSIS